MARRDPTFVALVALGALALLGGGLFAYVTARDTLRGTGDTTDPAPAALHTHRFASKAGGFSLRVPTDLTVKRSGAGARFTSADQDLVVSVGPIPGGPLRSATRGFLDTLRKSYPQVQVLGRRNERVGGHRALATYGRTRNAGRIPLRFVAVTVAARPRNYVLAAFTARDTDPTVVLPRVDTIVNSFRVRARH